MNGQRAAILLSAWAAMWPALSDVGAQSVALERPPSDFALRLETDCPAEVIDTGRHQFQRLVRPGDTMTAPLPLSEIQRQQIFAMVTEARLFEYPERFISPFAGAPFAPYSRYTISVTSGGRRHTIVWEAKSSGSDEARRLSTFILQLNAMVRTEPAIRALPPALPCA